MLSGRGLCDELITRPEESYRLWCVSECDCEASITSGPWPTGAVAPWKKKTGRHKLTSCESGRKRLAATRNGPGTEGSVCISLERGGPVISSAGGSAALQTAIGSYWLHYPLSRALAPPLASGTQHTHALSNSFSATIRVLSNMSAPGPAAMHISLRPEQVLVWASQGRPLNWHRPPLVLGDTSPKLLDANAATKEPCKTFRYTAGSAHSTTPMFVINWDRYMSRIS
jgi:hypothetical protein